MNKCVLFLVLFFIQASYASENLGELKIKTLQLKPYVSVLEHQRGGFKLGESFFAVEWLLEPNISGLFKLGSSQLINKKLLFETNNELADQALTFFEAYGQNDAYHGQFRFGLIPIPFSFESLLSEEHTHFPRSQVFEKRMISLRDLGMSYFTATKNYFSQIAIHNGEGLTNTDGQLWYSAIWGWKNSKGWKIGISGQTGLTEATSTNSSSFDLLNFDKSASSNWKNGGVFVQLQNKNFFTLLEGQMFVVEQHTQEIGRFYAGHWDFIYDYSPYAKILFRYDYFDPNGEEDNDYEDHISLGISFKNKTDTSTLYVIATKKQERPNDLTNDELRLIWRITPYSKE